MEAAVPLLLGTLGGTILGNVMQKKPPTVEPPKVMPTPDDQAMQRARRRSLAEQYGRRGRTSTILTDDDSLG